jgi:hypothetical protein
MLRRVTDYTLSFSHVHTANGNFEGGDLLILLAYFLCFEQEVLGRPNRLLSSDVTRTTWKTAPPTIFRCRWNVFTDPLLSNDRRIRRPTYFPLIQHGPHRKRVQQFLYCCVAVGTCLPNRCLGTVWGYTHKHKLNGGIYEVRR